MVFWLCLNFCTTWEIQAISCKVKTTQVTKCAALTDLFRRGHCVHSSWSVRRLFISRCLPRRSTWTQEDHPDWHGHVRCRCYHLGLGARHRTIDRWTSHQRNRKRMPRHDGSAVPKRDCAISYQRAHHLSAAVFHQPWHSFGVLDTGMREPRDHGTAHNRVI